MNTQNGRMSRTANSWGAATSFIFGSVGWLIGMTVPGPQHGTSLIATVCFSFVMGGLAFIPGSIAGRTIAELRARQT